MKRVHIFILLISILISSLKSFSQDYTVVHDNVHVKIEFLEDTIKLVIENWSDKSIFIPVDNYLQYDCSEQNEYLFLKFGIDIETFNERGIHKLAEIKVAEQRILKTKLTCSYSRGFHLIYEFYMRKLNKREKSKTFYNTDFTKETDWLIKGDWEWGELIINNKN